MGVTRKFLKGLGLTDDQMESIIEEHTSVIDALKTQISDLQSKTTELENVQKELSDLKAKANDGYEQKYIKEHNDFEEYKANIAKEKEESNKKDLYKALLRDAGVSEKRLNSILKVTDFSGMKVVDGKLDKATDLTDNIKNEWADFITTNRMKSGPVANPPKGNTGEGDYSDIRAQMAKMHEAKYGAKPTVNEK